MQYVSSDAEFSMYRGEKSGMSVFVSIGDQKEKNANPKESAAAYILNAHTALLFIVARRTTRAIGRILNKTKNPGKEYISGFESTATVKSDISPGSTFTSL